MLFNSAIVMLSFANKVVKVQPRKFVRSLCGVPRTLHLVSEVGFERTPTDVDVGSNPTVLERLW